VRRKALTAVISVRLSVCLSVPCLTKSREWRAWQVEVDRKKAHDAADPRAFPLLRYGWFSVTALNGLVTLTFNFSTSKWGHGSPHPRPPSFPKISSHIYRRASLLFPQSTNFGAHEPPRSLGAQCMCTGYSQLLTSVTTCLWSGHNYDSTSIRRPFDCLSKVIKVTVKQHGPLTR